MKITETGGVAGTGKSKKQKKTGDSGAFDALLGAAEEGGSTDASTAAGTASSVAAAGLFSLQEVEDHGASRQQSLAEGNSSLDLLEELRRDILLGEANERTLHRMKAQQQRMDTQFVDPSVKDIMADINLRLAVEIAKRESALA